MTFYTTVAEATSGSGDLLSALGINWQLLIIQIVAFLLLVALLGRFVYPWLMKSVDQRQKDIEDAKNASIEAQRAAQQSQKDGEALLDEARREATDIVATAKQEASDIVSTSEEKSRLVAERIAKEARDDIGRDVEAARKQLRAETLELVALATEKVVGKVHTKKPDEALIAEALKESK
ncbi:F0F1 ATP synthase subunit B [Candidatus Saccharibacteria bacterium]|nr:F0F1 ATP synthase subunit B [Candidatus Saccharibacteria bacterium]